MKLIGESHSEVLKKGAYSSAIYRLRNKAQEWVWVETSARLTGKGIVCLTRPTQEPKEGNALIHSGKDVSGAASAAAPDT